jgi:hypothetical protein
MPTQHCMTRDMPTASKPGWMANLGGLYCVSIGKAVFGESMFARRTDASKIALAALVALCGAQGAGWIDCQQNTAHLASLGAQEIDRIPLWARWHWPATKHPCVGTSSPYTGTGFSPALPSRHDTAQQYPFQTLQFTPQRPTHAVTFLGKWRDRRSPLPATWLATKPTPAWSSKAFVAVACSLTAPIAMAARPALHCASSRRAFNPTAVSAEHSSNMQGFRHGLLRQDLTRSTTNCICDTKMAATQAAA